MLANEDDVAMLDRKKAIQMGKMNIAMRTYYQARDAPQVEPDMAPMCALAASVVSVGREASARLPSVVEAAEREREKE